VVVFIDYQNAYRRARSAFCDEASDPHTMGQFHPVRLGMLVTDASTSSFPGDQRELKQVRVYRGVPDPQRDERGYAACSRQIGAWGSDPLVRVHTRLLAYPQAWPSSPPKEKGVDVSLAVDFLAMAIRGEYDVGVIVSQDNDLLPALEAVDALGEKNVCGEVTAWAPTPETGYRLRLRGRPLWCHYITPQQFAAIADGRDYNVSS
jgi:NYN domain